MIRMFLGKPGGGKSYGALKDIVEEILNGHRRIVTNLSIDVGALSAWIQKNYPDADFDPLKRFRLLTDTETKTFWMCRGPQADVDPKTADDKIALGHFGTVTPDQLGVLYVIDEAHIHFDARAWAQTGHQLTYYNSQHRKYQDEVVFVTQFLELIDKRVKGFAQDYVYFVNNGLQRFMTYFRLPKYFTVKSFGKPRSGGTQDVPMAVWRYQLDPTLAACYDTSAGVGIPGRKKIEVNRIKGLPIFWIAVPVLAVAVALFYIPDVMTKGVKAALDRGQPKPATKTAPADTAPTSHQGVDGLPTPKGGGNPPAPTAPTPAVDSGPPPARVYVRSVARAGKDAIVTLTNGEIITKATGLAAISNDYVYLLDGTKYQRRRGTGGSAEPARGP